MPADKGWSRYFDEPIGLAGSRDPDALLQENGTAASFEAARLARVPTPRD
jgi:hypothetical protein